MYTTDPLIKKSTAIFSILLAFGLAMLMQSAGYYYEGVRYNMTPPQSPEYLIEKSIIINFGIVEGMFDYIKIDVKPADKRKSQNSYTLSAPLTSSSTRLHNGMEIDLYFLQRKGISLNGNSLWRIQDGDWTIVNEREMSIFLKQQQLRNFGVSWMAGIIGGILCASAFIYSWRTKRRKQPLSGKF